MAKGRGGGETPQRVVEKLKEAVGLHGLRTVSRDTGLALAPLSRYLKGESEPSQASFEKLAAYFSVSVAWLRGYSEADKNEMDAMLDEMQRNLAIVFARSTNPDEETIEGQKKVDETIRKIRLLMSEKSKRDV